jgi:hypothetical protein
VLAIRMALGPKHANAVGQRSELGEQTSFDGPRHPWKVTRQAGGSSLTDVKRVPRRPAASAIHGTQLS